jgi:hypothetical protein
MQIQQDQINRPRLIEPFLHLELTPSNDYVEYINTTSADNNVTSLQNDSINSFSTCQYLQLRPQTRFFYINKFDFFYIHEPIKQLCEEILIGARFSILPQSRNGMSSLM